jgi:SAM-dependent methyltransferase
MIFQGEHGILSQPSHDEFAREDCVVSMRKFFTSELFPGNRKIYKDCLLPAFTKKHGRAPSSRREVKELMDSTFYYRCAGLLGRATQELLWDTVGDSVERQIDSLMEKAAPRKTAVGTLELNPDLEMPKYIEAVDIHVMPGNFQTELAEGDVLAGALYDRGAYLFGFGGAGPYGGGMASTLIDLVKNRFPDFKPKRILDMGCGVGWSTLPLKEAFPDAEVYGLDIGAPMLRYAHARAESLGVPIHFSQQNVVATNYPDGFFDLVVSVLIHHEMPSDVIKATVQESYRLLPSGGIMIHEGYPRRADPLDDFLSSWFVNNNNEPFSNAQYDIDYTTACTEAGFAKEDVFNEARPAVYLKGQNIDINFRGAVKR